MLKTACFTTFNNHRLTAVYERASEVCTLHFADGHTRIYFNDVCIKGVQSCNVIATLSVHPPLSVRHMVILRNMAKHTVETISPLASPIVLDYMADSFSCHA